MIYMAANWLGQFLFFLLVDAILFLAYCLAALYLPFARLSRYLRNTFGNRLV